MPFAYNRFKNTNTPLTTLYVPGWAMDGEIFEKTHSQEDAIVINSYDPFTLEKDIKNLLYTENISQAHFIGFSMGAMAGASLCFEEIIKWTWIAPALHYPKPITTFIQKQLHAQSELYLFEFYKSCFYSTDDFNHFWNRYGLRLSKTLTTPSLERGLSFLSECDIQPRCFNKALSYEIIYGKLDQIVPDQDLHAISMAHPNQTRFLPNKGHFVLASND